MVTGFGISKEYRCKKRYIESQVRDTYIVTRGSENETRVGPLNETSFLIIVYSTFVFEREMKVVFLYEYRSGVFLLSVCFVSVNGVGSVGANQLSVGRRSIYSLDSVLPRRTDLGSTKICTLVIYELQHTVNPKTLTNNTSE